MLILDDLLLSPFRGLLWVFRKVHQAAEDELESRRTTTRAELNDLYMELETGRITEEEFDAREKVLLDRLEHLSGDESTPAPGEPTTE